MNSSLIEARRYVGEFLATFFFLFTAQGAAYYSATRETSGLVSTTGILFAGIVAVGVFGSLSGAHFNPSVTIGIMVGGRMPPVRGIIYIVIQIVAGILATLFLGFLYPEQFTDVAKKMVVSVPEESYWWPAVVMEVVMTFILVFVVYAVAAGLPNKSELRGGKTGGIITENGEAPSDREISQKSGRAAVAIGSTLGFLSLIGGPSSGGAFNPARATGPAIVGTEFSSLWVYWVGGIIGPFLAALIWTFLFF